VTADFDALARMYKASAEEAWGEGTGTISTAHYIQVSTIWLWCTVRQ